MLVRSLAALAAVFAVPAVALACPGAKSAGATTVSAGECPHAARAAAGEGCPYAKAGASCDPAACSHGTAEATITASAGKSAACGAHEKKPGQVTVAELAAQLQASPAAVPVDANNEGTRARDGVIPGAKLLTSASAYDPALEIGAPKDAHLVFYCANTRCTASHTAAQRALDAGYTKVSILPEGIAGWKAAGQATSAVPRS